MVHIMLALLGATISSAGTVLQKKGLGWVSLRKNKQGKFLALFSTWLLGIFLAYFISAIPVSIASKVLSPHIITAMSGWGIVVILFLSFFFLKERIYASDIVYSLVILICTMVIGLSSKPVASMEINRPVLILLFALPFSSILPALVKSLDTKIKASLFAIFAGCMSGVAIVFFNILVRQYFAGGFYGLSTDILVLYVLSAVLGAIGEQFSYKLGEMTVVASIRLSLFIIYPVLCSVLLFGTRIDTLQIISMVLIIVACYGIFRKR